MEVVCFVVLTSKSSDESILFFICGFQTNDIKFITTLVQFECVFSFS